MRLSRLALARFNPRELALNLRQVDPSHVRRTETHARRASMTDRVLIPRHHFFTVTARQFSRRSTVRVLRAPLGSLDFRLASPSRAVSLSSHHPRRPRRRARRSRVSVRHQRIVRERAVAPFRVFTQQIRGIERAEFGAFGRRRRRRARVVGARVAALGASVERVVVVVVVVARSRARRDDVVVAAAPHRRRNVTRRPEKTPRNRAREKRRASVEER